MDDDDEKSLAYKLGLLKATPLKIQKNKGWVDKDKNVLAVSSSATFIVSSVKLTPKDMDHLNVLAKATTATHSAIMRSLVRLAATDGAVRAKLMTQIAQDHVPRGRPKNKPERNTAS